MPRSVAFQSALDEVVRIWDAADHLDTKILQFASIVTAGTLAGAGLALGHFRDDQVGMRGLVSALVGVLVILGVLYFVGFFVLMLRSAIGTRFAGPIDPRELAKRPEFLNDDAGFEQEVLPAIAQAFEISRVGVVRKLQLFWIGVCALGLSLACVASALLLIWFASSGSLPRK